MSSPDSEHAIELLISENASNVVGNSIPVGVVETKDFELIFGGLKVQMDAFGVDLF